MTDQNKQAMPELPKAHGEAIIYDFNAKPQDPIRYRDVFTADQMHAFRAEGVESLRVELEAARAANEKLIQDLKGYADAKYCKAMGILQTPEGKGWEYKAANKLFGEAEFEAHKTANQAFGAHFGIYEALRLAALNHTKEQSND